MEKNRFVKVCGLTASENIEALLNTEITHVGFIFYKKTPRCANNKLDPKFVKGINKVKKVGVFVNAEKSEIEENIKTYGLNLIQLHGDESPDFCKSLEAKIPVMKAFKIKSEKDILKAEKYEKSCHYFLFDAAGKSPGGNGILFNWNLLQAYHGKTPFFLSGGIGLEETKKLQSFSHPQWVGIDINSKFETRPGYKNIKKIQEFLHDIGYRNPMQ